VKTLLPFLASLLLATTGLSYTYILDNSTGLPVKWPAGGVPLKIMLGTDKNLTDGNTFSSSAQAAAQAWNALLGDLAFQTQVTTGTPGNGNGVNELAFASTMFGRSFGTGTLAITTTLTGQNGNARAESDTLFNTAFTWDSYRGPLQRNVQDIQRVAIHELGHSLGLDHPDSAGQSVDAIMNSRISDIDAPTSDDITGAQNLYGPPGVPANDNFANAIAITTASATTTVKGYNTNATKETGEPDHAGNPGGHSIWWKWTPQASGSVTIDTKGSYSDTTLAVYTGSALTSLTSVASNDDINPGVVQASTVTFSATAGTTYFIAVDGFNGIAQGDTTGADSAGITLNIAFAAAATPSITTQPSNQTVTAGNNASFTVTATGNAPLSYQWSFGSTAISGATSATFSIANAQAANSGSYTVTVSNSLGSVTSTAATLTVTAAVVNTPPPAPSGGGGGGGGAIDLWFVTLLSMLGIGRSIFRSRR
jgi:hypothetical protein